MTLPGTFRVALPPPGTFQVVSRPSSRRSETPITRRPARPCHRFTSLLHRSNPSMPVPPPHHALHICSATLRVRVTALHHRALAPHLDVCSLVLRWAAPSHSIIDSLAALAACSSSSSRHRFRGPDPRVGARARGHRRQDAITNREICRQTRSSRQNGVPRRKRGHEGQHVQEPQGCSRWMKRRTCAQIPEARATGSCYKACRPCPPTPGPLHTCSFRHISLSTPSRSSQGRGTATTVPLVQ